MEEGTTERVNQKHEIGPDRSFLKDLHRWERVEPGVRETRVRKQTQLPDRGEGGGRREEGGPTAIAATPATTATDRSLRPISLRRPQFRYKRQSFPPGRTTEGRTKLVSHLNLFRRLVSCHYKQLPRALPLAVPPCVASLSFPHSLFLSSTHHSLIPSKKRTYSFHAASDGYRVSIHF